MRIRLTHSGINPGDVGKRSGQGAPMPFPRVIPHSDGAGVIDAVGADVADTRVGERVWCHGYTTGTHEPRKRPIRTNAESHTEAREFGTSR